ncbi:MAG: hypothetical protein QOF84_3164 [Streptomyces sp.]|jgi:hypothetical protein|nr:hypothetical protein [Streptomyces sp.]
MKSTGLYLLLSVLGLGLLAIGWSALSQLSSLPGAGAVTTAAPTSRINCSSPAPPDLTRPGRTGGGRWVFVQQDGPGGYVLNQSGREPRQCADHFPDHR